MHLLHVLVVYHIVLIRKSLVELTNNQKNNINGFHVVTFSKGIKTKKKGLRWIKKQLKEDEKEREKEPSSSSRFGGCSQSRYLYWNSLSEIF